jgi:hypothetical protein
MMSVPRTLSKLAFDNPSVRLSQRSFNVPFWACFSQLREHGLNRENRLAKHF